MSLGRFFKGMFGSKGLRPESASPEAPPSSPAPPPLKRRNVAVFSASDALRAHLVRQVAALASATDCSYAENPPFEDAGKYQIVIFHAVPGDSGRLSRVARALRLSSRNFLLCAIGQRMRYWQYPKGTYAKMLYFCLEGDDYSHREADLPREGLPTSEGPRLHNLPDLPEIVAKKLDDLRYAG